MVEIVKINPLLLNIPLQELRDDDLVNIFEYRLSASMYQRFVLATIPEAELSAEYALATKKELLKRLKNKAA